MANGFSLSAECVGKKKGVKSIANRSALAGLASRLREVGQRPSEVHPLAQERRLKKLLGILIDEPDYEWLMIDASHVKVHPNAAGALGGNLAMDCTKGGLKPKYIWPWDMPIRILVTESTRADCKEAVHLIEGISAEVLPADRGYDINDILAHAPSAGMESEILPKKNRKEQRDYDKHLYKLRHLVENCFLSLKRWRRIATGAPRLSDAFIAAVHLRCITIWAAICARLL